MRAKARKALASIGREAAKRRQKAPRCPHHPRIPVDKGPCYQCKVEADLADVHRLEEEVRRGYRALAPAELAIHVVDTGRTLRFRIPPQPRKRRR